jgi:hypothetical protein
MIANSSAPLTDPWSFGSSPLDHAWFHFASEAMKAQYRVAHSEHSMRALQALMEVEVRQFLAIGELRAIGIALPLRPESAPEEISTLLFAAHSTEIDWANSTICGLGCSFGEVRVVRATEPASAISPIQSIIASELADRGSSGGRNSTYAYSAKVLAMLLQTEDKRHLSAEKLHPAFRAEFERQFPLAEYQTPPPSVRTLRDQLKRFRRESAETGNN